MFESQSQQKNYQQVMQKNIHQRANPNEESMDKHRPTAQILQHPNIDYQPVDRKLKYHLSTNVPKMNSISKIKFQKKRPQAYQTSEDQYSKGKKSPDNLMKRENALAASDSADYEFQKTYLVGKLRYERYLTLTRNSSHRYSGNTDY